METRNAGRGSVATADMKARIDALRREGADVLDVLWSRNHKATTGGEGFSYEYAGKAEQV